MLNENMDMATEGQKEEGRKALIVVDRLLQDANHGQKLNDLQSAVFLGTWLQCSYSEIAQQLDYEHDYIKQVGSHLWRSLFQVLGEPVSKRNIQSVLRRHTTLKIQEPEFY